MDGQKFFEQVVGRSDVESWEKHNKTSASTEFNA